MGEGVLRGESGSGDLPPRTYVLALMSPRRVHKREVDFPTKVPVEVVESVVQSPVQAEESEATPAAGGEDQSSQKPQGDSSHSLDVTPVATMSMEKESDAIELIDVEKEAETAKRETSNVSRPSVLSRRITRLEFKRLNGVLDTTPSKECENHSSDLRADSYSIEIESKPWEKSKASRPSVFPRRITRSEFKRLNGVLDTYCLKESGKRSSDLQADSYSIETAPKPSASEPIRVLKKRRLNGNDNAMKRESGGDEIAENGVPDRDGEMKKLLFNAVEDPSSLQVPRNSAWIESAEHLEATNLAFSKVDEESGSKMTTGSSHEVVCPRDQEESGSSGGDVAINQGNVQGSMKKLKLKVSKKILLTKFPKTIKDLLATGLLDGCKVRYLHRALAKEDLRGVVENGKILCFCSSCKGKQTVSPVQFELHAGSVNRRATDYIYLENGKAIRDILRSCLGTPLEMLEERMQTEIRSSDRSKLLTCEGCKEPTNVTTHGKSRPLCQKCLDLQQTPAKRQSPRRPQNNNVEAKNCTSSPGKLRLPRSPITLKPSCIYSVDKVSKNKSTPAKLTRKDLGLHKLVFMSKGLPDGTEVAYYARGQRLLEGYKQGFGIFCYCCNTEVSPSQFEAHAGWASRRKPYLHIYTSDGVSLHELSISLTKGRKKAASDNDDLCTICGDGGDLLLCDGCPRAFHTECIDFACIPRGKWYCSYCQHNFEDERVVAQNQNALAAGRVLGMDALEKINRRCTRVVKKPHIEVGGGCVLCRGHDFSKSGFGPRTVMLCDQCEREFHVGCLRDHGLGDLKELPEGKWFCCTDCKRINISLEKLVLRGPEKLSPSLSDTIKKKLEEEGSDSDTDRDISWTLLSGKIASPNSRLLLSKAVAIFQDCFDPIIDTASGRDLIPPMVYGRNTGGQEFGGIYCAVLTVNSTVVSAGVIRIFGKEVAELPLVATSSENQGKGYFQSLFSCIERFLGFLEVKNLVLPAADEAESIWTKRFGFSKMSQDEFSNYTRDMKMMIFHGTSMLQKPVPKFCVVTRQINAHRADAS